MESESGIARCQVLYVACSDPVRYEITLVEDKHNLLVRLLLPDKFQDALAKGTHRVASIENMEDNVG